MEEGLYLEFVPLNAQGNNNSFTAYLVYRDGRGNDRVIQNTRGSEVDLDLSQSTVKYGAGETRNSRQAQKLDLGGRNPAEVWSAMKAEAGRLRDGGNTEAKGNALVRALLEAGSIKAEMALPRTMMPGDLPGFEEGPSEAGLDKISPDNAAWSKDKNQERDAFLKDLGSPADPVDAILLKQPAQWTADEKDAVQKAVMEMGAADPRRDGADAKVRQWYGHFYGTGPVEKDPTGRMIEPQLRSQPPKTPVAARDANGKDIMTAVKEIGAKVADLASKDSLPAGVKTLQTALNLLPRGGEAAAPQTLKEDGEFGPKTKGALHAAVAGLGKPKVEETLALARFEDYGKKRLQGETGSGLGAEAVAAFSDLYPKQANAAWKQALQEAINLLGKDTLGADRWTAIKEDGLLGPKTEGAFDSALKRSGPRAFTERLGQTLGFLK